MPAIKNLSDGTAAKMTFPSYNDPKERIFLRALQSSIPGGITTMVESHRHYRKRQGTSMSSISIMLGVSIQLLTKVGAPVRIQWKGPNASRDGYPERTAM